MGITISLVLFCMILNTIAQVFLKTAMNRIGSFSFTLENVVPIGLKVVLSPFIILGLICYVLSVVVWLMVLSRNAVSVAYPLTSIAFILTAFSAYFFLGESLSFIRIIGIFVIIFGIYLITR